MENMAYADLETPTLVGDAVVSIVLRQECHEFTSLNWELLEKDEHFKIEKDLSHPENVHMPVFIEFLTATADTRICINGKKIASRQILGHNDVVSSASKKLMFVYKDRRRYVPDAGLPESDLKKYHFVTELGSGAFATVFHVYCRERLTAYAIKSIPKRANEIGQPLVGNREAAILRVLKHSGITRLIRHSETPQSTILELELMHGGNLFTRIEMYDCLPEELCAFYFYQIAQALTYLHYNEITHRDIKPENILLKTAEDKTIVKLTDFGLAKLNTEMITRCGTLPYVAPEVLNNGRFTEKVDVWSMGVCLYSALSGTFPFGHSGDQKTEDNIRDGHFAFDSPNWQNVSTESQDLIQSMLKKDANERPSIRSLLLEHSWFQRHDAIVREADKLMKKEAIANCFDPDPVTLDYVQLSKRHRGPGH